MRKRGERKRGELSLAEATQKANTLIAEHGICLLILDVVESTNYGAGSDVEKLKKFHDLLAIVNEHYKEYMPLNNLVAGQARSEQGLVPLLGDAATGGITNPSMVELVEAIRAEKFPDLEIYYGIAQDGWSEGIELVK